MRWNEANKQLQCWPTPQVYIRRTGGDLAENGTADLQLAAFEAILAQTVTGSEDGTSALALSGFIVNGKQPVDVGSDNANADLALSAFVAVIAQTASAQTDSGTSDLALSGFVAVTAQIAAAQTDNATAQLALSSFVI